jgi:heme exporter protein D
MGGYAVFVWPSYAVAFGVMGGLLIWAWLSARQGEAEVERLRAAGLDPRRRAASAERPQEEQS